MYFLEDIEKHFQFCALMSISLVQFRGYEINKLNKCFGSTYRRIAKTPRPLLQLELENNSRKLGLESSTTRT